MCVYANVLKRLLCILQLLVSAEATAVRSSPQASKARRAKCKMYAPTFDQHFPSTYVNLFGLNKIVLCAKLHSTCWNDESLSCVGMMNLSHAGMMNLSESRVWILQNSQLFSQFVILIYARTHVRKRSA